MHADAIVVVAFGQIIPEEILDASPWGCINVHASLLPSYRGAAPIQWAVINGDKVSRRDHRAMDTGLDTGDMTYERAVDPWTGMRPAGSLFDKLSSDGGGAFAGTHAGRPGKGSVTAPAAAAETPHSVCGDADQGQGHIDWTQDRAIRSSG